jgi:hypothetical protein
MRLNWNCQILGATAFALLLCHANATTAQTQKAQVKKPVDAQTQADSIDEKDIAYCKQFLDKNGGYKNRKGGYYNPTAGTYTDEVGGVVDNWSGYTYKDGSYKTKFGDFYDSKLHMVKTTTGENIQMGPQNTPAQIIQTMREDVADQGGYDKDLARRSMYQDIKFEHPIPHAK